MADELRVGVQGAPGGDFPSAGSPHRFTPSRHRGPGNILVVYANRRFPLRATVRDHLYSFGRYLPDRVFYLNLGVRRVPRYLRTLDFDLIIFHTTFLSARWRPRFFRRLVQKAAPLRSSPAAKVALPQDDFLNADALCHFVNNFHINHIFSAAPDFECLKIYRSVNPERVQFHHVLTGYLDEGTLQKIRKMEMSRSKRSIDVGYRAWHAPPWLGRHGTLKTRIADVFQNAAPAWGFTTDISTREEDTLLGDRWYEFLLRCRYTLGSEGGASVLDHDGSIKERTETYLRSHPGACFEEVERHCFPAQDGRLTLRVLTPRHLEACATRTCQVLVEGEYEGILRPGIHYLEVKRDFSNLDSVFKEMGNEERRRHIVDRAHRDIVESGAYTYRTLVNFVVTQAREAGPSLNSRTTPRAVPLWTDRWMRLADAASWCFVGVGFGLYQLACRLAPRLALRD
jgi:hypothetical protein